MALYHFSAKVFQRSAGRSAVAAAAYRAAEMLYSAREGRTFNYLSKPGVIHSEILLPESAPERWLDRALLWNEVEAVERRVDAQLAREIELALPRELGRAEAIRLARDFVDAQFVGRGMVADLNVHWAIGPDGEAQPHAHIMLALREISGGGFGKKQRAWNDRSLLRHWREDWAALVNARLAEAGHDIRVDHRSNAAQGIDLEPQHKIGPAGARRAARGEDAERTAEHRAIARSNGERIFAEPRLALSALTRQQSTFTRQDLARFVNTHTADAAQFDAVMAKVEASPELVRVGQDGRGRERFSTREMVALERRMVASAVALDARPAHPVALARRQGAPVAAGLGEEQALAFFHVTRARDLSVVCGIAGGGKSTLFSAARQAWEQEGYRVRGAALSGIAAEGLERSAGIASRTLASLEYAWAQGKELLTSNDILVVDEAGMLGSRQLGRLVETVQASGAKLVLSGDPEQLQAIEAGAALRAIAGRVGVAEIVEPRRQQEAWQKQATKELASGRTADALARYEAASMTRQHATLDETQAALVAGWAAERQKNPRQSRLMLTHTRASARVLNDLARAARRQAGELGPEHVLATGQGPLAFAEGERIYFLRNDRSLGVKNGTLGVLEKIDGGHLAARLDGEDGAPGAGRRLEFDLGDYAAIGHGYAATIHKSQGATVDVTHILATGGMDRHLAYVALSRHRDGARLHWSADEFGSRDGLNARLGRERAKDTSLDYGLDYDPGRDFDPDFDADFNGDLARGEAEALAAYAGCRGLSRRRDAADTAGAVPAEQRRQEIRARVAADPGLARRNLRRRRIEQALRPVLPALTRAIERAGAAAEGFGVAVARLDATARAFALAAKERAAARKQEAATAAAAEDDLLRNMPCLAAIPASAKRDSFGRGADHLAAFHKNNGYDRDAANDWWARVEDQRERDLIEIPGLSRRARGALFHITDAGISRLRPEPTPRLDAPETIGAAKAAAIWSAILADQDLRGEVEQFMAAMDARFPDGCAPPPGEQGDAAGVLAKRTILRNAAAMHAAHLDRAARKGRPVVGTRVKAPDNTAEQNRMAARREPLLAAIPLTAHAADSLGRIEPRRHASELERGYPKVGAARADLSYILKKAYRDPARAARILEDLDRDGVRPEAAQALVDKTPELLGELKGEGGLRGLFASAAAREERKLARYHASTAGRAFTNRWYAEMEAVELFTKEVEDQRRRDAVEVPALSAEAMDAVQRLQCAGAKPDWWNARLFVDTDRMADAAERRLVACVAPVWANILANEPLEWELARFVEAGRKRLPAQGLANAVRLHPERTSRELWRRMQDLESTIGVIAAAKEMRLAHPACQAYVETGDAGQDMKWRRSLDWTIQEARQGRGKEAKAEAARNRERRQIEARREQELAAIRARLLVERMNKPGQARTIAAARGGAREAEAEAEARMKADIAALDETELRQIEARWKQEEQTRRRIEHNLRPVRKPSSPEPEPGPGM